MGIVFYDGVCGLCNGFVRFLLAADRRGRLRFAPLQGTTAAALRARRPFPPSTDSIVFSAGEEVSFKSAAVLGILSSLGGPWRLAALFRGVPRVFRDALYDFVAARRYRWFGRYDACPLPDPAVRGRFLP